MGNEPSHLENEMHDRIAIVIPTYNEAKNIGRLLRELKNHYPQIKIFVVDDNSPDGTAQVVQNLAFGDETIRLIWREQKMGLASAYLDAFARIIPDEAIHYIVTMDADFSHHPEDLEFIIKEVPDHDIVVGSRYVDGGRISNWSFWRKTISKYANLYAKLVTGVPVNDLTAGFVAYHRNILGKILLDGIGSEGYAYQIEMKHAGHELGARIKEVPITFRERNSGRSKFGLRTVIEAMYRPWYWRFRRSGRRFSREGL